MVSIDKIDDTFHTFASRFDDFILGNVLPPPSWGRVSTRSPYCLYVISDV